MNDQIREQLIGYVLGALDPAEQREVEDRLSTDELWRRELDEVQRMLEPLADGYTTYEVPKGLAERTCRFVAAESARLDVTRPGTRHGLSNGLEAAAGGQRWRMADWVVMSGICLAAVAFLFPALLTSRMTARLMACQNNLRELGLALTHLSDISPDHSLPPVDREGNQCFAGIYAPKLMEAGLLHNVTQVICPESQHLADVAMHRIPSLSEIDAAQGDEILLLQKSAGGTYAYPLGFVEEGRHVPPRILGRPYFVLMSDAPATDVGRFAVHGDGMNVLFEDGHIELLCDWSGTARVDNPYCNRLGRVEAGTDIDDAVVAPSYYPPLLHSPRR
ncbi:MAG: hypothetical protein AB7F89_06025 [Pirellulaceae bacterium]